VGGVARTLNQKRVLLLYQKKRTFGKIQAHHTAHKQLICGEQPFIERNSEKPCNLGRNSKLTYVV